MAKRTKRQLLKVAQDMHSKAKVLFQEGLITPNDLMAVRKIVIKCNNQLGYSSATGWKL